MACFLCDFPDAPHRHFFHTTQRNESLCHYCHNCASLHEARHPQFPFFASVMSCFDFEFRPWW